MNNEYRSDYEVRLATLAALGGDTTKDYRSVYEVDLAILAATGEAVKGLKPVVVDVLPTTGEAGKIYFVPKTAGDKDNYKEYVWVNNAWECIGNANVDLSSYATKTYVDSSLALKADKTYVDSSLNNKQNTLISGTNIKTINGSSLLGEGNIEISGGIDESDYIYITPDAVPSDDTVDKINAAITQGANLATLIKVGNSGNARTVISNQLYSGNGIIYIDTVGGKCTVKCLQGRPSKGQVWASSIYYTIGATFGCTNVYSLTLTQAEYDALETKDSNCLYIISDAE